MSDLEVQAQKIWTMLRKFQDEKQDSRYPPTVHELFQYDDIKSVLDAEIQKLVEAVGDVLAVAFEAERVVGAKYITYDSAHNPIHMTMTAVVKDEYTVNMIYDFDINPELSIINEIQLKFSAINTRTNVVEGKNNVPITMITPEGLRDVFRKNPRDLQYEYRECEVRYKDAVKSIQTLRTTGKLNFWGPEKIDELMKENKTNHRCYLIIRKFMNKLGIPLK